MLLNEDECIVLSKIILTSSIFKNYYANNFNKCISITKLVYSIVSSFSVNLRILHFKDKLYVFAQNLPLAKLNQPNRPVTVTLENYKLNWIADTKHSLE